MVNIIAGRAAAFRGDFPLEQGAPSAHTSIPMALKSEPGVVPAILLSDQSIIEQGTQKRTIVGIFDQISLPNFPSPYGRFWVTAWISNIIGTLTEMELTCRVQKKSGGHVLHSSNMKIEFKGEAPFNDTTTIAFSTSIRQITFPHQGVYSIVILLNGEEVGTRDFNVIQKEPKPTQNP